MEATVQSLLVKWAFSQTASDTNLTYHSLSCFYCFFYAQT